VVKIKESGDRCRAVIAADRTKLAAGTGPLQTLRAHATERPLSIFRECAVAFATWLRREPDTSDTNGTRIFH
jgi:hypothetical protein